MHFILIFTIFYQFFHKITGNSLTVILDSKWENTPLVAEASEFIAAESLGLFWNFVDELNLCKDKFDLNNEIKNYENVWRVAKKLLNTGQMSVLQLSLSMRTYSPAVEMNNQLDTDLNCLNSFTAVKVADQNFCELNKLEDFILSNKDYSLHNTTLYKTDKIYPGIEKLSNLKKGIPIVIVYSDLRDKDFYNWHNKIIEFAKQQKAYYVFRHKIKNRSGTTRLSGYGVELAIKSTEYKAVDDTKFSLGGQDENLDSKTSPGVENFKENEDDEVQGFIFTKLKELHPNSSHDLDAFKHHLLTSDSEIRPLKSWQMQELSLKAGQFVMNSLENNEALETLRDISQNYPVRAHYLAQVPVSTEFKNELTVNQVTLEQSYNIQPGQTLVTFNGYILSQDLDMYEILDLARREMGVMTKLHDFGLQGNHISSLMNVQHSSSEGSNSASPFLLDIRQAPVIFVNNLEKDRRYSSWPKSVNDLLSPTYPGMMRRVAKNFFNAILVLDPATLESRDYVKFVEAFIIHNAPIRMGFLWAIDPDTPLADAPGRALVRAFNFVSGEKEDPLSALSFITDLYSSIEDNEEISIKMVKDFLKSKHPDADMEIVFGEKSDYDDNIKASWKYLHDSGILKLTKPFVLMNGLLIDSKSLNENGFEESVVNNVLLTTNELQKLVMNHQLVDGIPVLDLLMSSDNVVNRLNNRLLENSNSQFISFTKSLDKLNISSEQLKSLNSDQISTYMADSIKYFIKNDDISNQKSTTIWVVVDVENKEGRSHFQEALKWVQNSYNTRVGLIQNPSSENTKSFLNRAVFNIINKLPIDLARKSVTALLEGPSGLSFQQIWESFIEENENIKHIVGDINIVNEDYLVKDQIFIESVLKSKPGESFLIANGKIIGPFDGTETLIKDDFKLVERSCSGAKKILARLQELLGGGVLKSKLLSDLTNKIHAVLQKDLTKSSSSAQVGVVSTSKKIEIKGLKEEYSGFSLMGHISKPAFDLVAIIDPLSRATQKLSHIMLILKETLNLNVRVIFNCKDKLSEQPLKSFYRFVLDASPVTRNDDGNIVSLSNPKAQFSLLPGQPLLTLGLEPIHNWLVEPTKSIYDLDNLRFSDVKNGVVHAYFELEYLLLEGHCVDTTTGQPPRGLQFVLSNNDVNRTTYDTIVMANLGYFQLKATPGAWNLRLREGKSRDIYDIQDHEFTDSDEKSSDLIAVLNSFRAKIIRVKVNKKPSRINENLLSESKLDEETRSIWASISSAFSKSSSKSTVENETINIFSVASGHLYERFLRIMMTSVLKQTKSKVKFWFLKNYLSPTFKEFIPHMAKKYGFEYDLVQYKWPRWLHQQTEKQRIIWGYKILFLDVLFPLNISKIIFVDADQMVRADLKELVDLDLEGAPYGYTPFCSSKPEMDGFRFWKSGYWSQHLAGRPYHISALYVVDLNRFRMMAAGDRLRGQYHGLSQDPNSLANLDQDLPNNMIHQVPIKSLPQEWLWCETWCSAEEKVKAKTIDLCNNPMTKEPKLSAAMRILPEWNGYDEEIKSLWNEVYSLKPKEPYPSQQETTEQLGNKDIPSLPKTEL